LKKEGNVKRVCWGSCTCICVNL